MSAAKRERSQPADHSHDHSQTSGFALDAQRVAADVDLIVNPPPHRPVPAGGDRSRADYEAAQRAWSDRRIQTLTALSASTSTSPLTGWRLSDFYDFTTLRLAEADPDTLARAVSRARRGYEALVATCAQSKFTTLRPLQRPGTAGADAAAAAAVADRCVDAFLTGRATSNASIRHQLRLDDAAVTANCEGYLWYLHHVLNSELGARVGHKGEGLSSKFWVEKGNALAGDARRWTEGPARRVDGSALGRVNRRERTATIPTLLASEVDGLEYQLLYRPSFNLRVYATQHRFDHEVVTDIATQFLADVDAELLARFGVGVYLIPTDAHADKNPPPHTGPLTPLAAAALAYWQTGDVTLAAVGEGLARREPDSLDDDTHDAELSEFLGLPVEIVWGHRLTIGALIDSARGSRATQSPLPPESHLLQAIATARTERDTAAQTLRCLIAYGRSQTHYPAAPRPTLEAIGEAAGLTISGVRTAYGDEDIARVQELLDSDESRESKPLLSIEERARLAADYLQAVFELSERPLDDVTRQLAEDVFAAAVVVENSHWWAPRIGVVVAHRWAPPPGELPLTFTAAFNIVTGDDPRDHTGDDPRDHTGRSSTGRWFWILLSNYLDQDEHWPQHYAVGWPLLQRYGARGSRLKREAFEPLRWHLEQISRGALANQPAQTKVVDRIDALLRTATATDA